MDRSRFIFNEKRQFRRLGYQCFAKFRLKINETEGEAVSWFNSVTTNISAGGLLFPADMALPSGTLLDLQIYIPFLKNPLVPASAVGEVARVEEIVPHKVYHVGARFLDIAEDNKTAIDSVAAGLS